MSTSLSAFAVIYCVQHAAAAAAATVVLKAGDALFIKVNFFAVEVGC